MTNGTRQLRPHNTMLRLIRYECFKLASHKILMLVSFAVVALLLTRFTLYCSSRPSCDYTLYQKTLATLKEDPDSVSAEDLQTESIAISVSLQKEFLRESGLSDTEIQDRLSLIFGDLSIYQTIIRDYEAQGLTFEELQKKSVVLATLAAQYEYVGSYQTFIGEMPERIAELKRANIFADKKSYSYRSIDKSLRDFQRLGEIRIEPDYNFGIQECLAEFDWSFVFITALMLIAASILIADETESRIMALQLTAKRGRGMLASAKWLALIVYGIFFAAIVSACRIVIAGTIMGFGDTSRSLQSVSMFRNCCYRISVRQWLWCTILFSVITAIVSGTLILSLISMLKKVWAATTVMAVVLVGGIVFYRFIPDNAALNFLKFLNLSVLADPAKRFSVYSNVNLFGYPVSVLPAALTFFSLLLILSLVLYGLSFSGQIRLPLPQPLKHRKALIRGSVSLPVHELFRFLVTGLGTLALLALIFMNLSMVKKGALLVTQEDYFYYRIGQEISGRIHDETEIEIEKIRQNLLSLTTDNQTDSLRAAYERVQKEFLQLKAAKGRGIPVHYISEIITEPFFGADRHFLYFGLLLAAVLSVSVNPLFAEDQDTGLVKLVRTTKNGRREVFRSRYLVIFIMYLAAYAGYMVPFLIDWIVRRNMNDWHAPLQSIVALSESSGNMSILLFLVLWIVNTLLSAAVLIVLTSFLSQLIKRKSTNLIVSVAIIIADFLTNILHFPVLSAMAVSGGFGLVHLVEQTGTVMIVYGIAGKNLLLLILLLIVHKRIYCK